MSGILIFANIEAGVPVASGKWATTFDLGDSQAAVIVDPMQVRTLGRLSTLVDCLQSALIAETNRRFSDNATGIVRSRYSVQGWREAELQGWGRSGFSSEGLSESRLTMWQGRAEHSQAAIASARHQAPLICGHSAAVVVELDNLTSDAELLSAAANVISAVKTIGDAEWAEILANATNGLVPV